LRNEANEHNVISHPTRAATAKKVDNGVREAADKMHNASREAAAE